MTTFRNIVSIALYGFRLKFYEHFWTTNSIIKAMNDRQTPPAKIQKIPPTFSMSKLELCA